MNVNFDEMNPMISAKKREAIMDIYVKENFTKEDHNEFLKVMSMAKDKKTPLSLATADDYKTKKPMTRKRYIELIDEKTSSYNKVSKERIVIEKDKKFLRVITYSSTHYYDFDNPQKGIVNKKYLRSLYEDIKSAGDKAKVIVVFGGDLVGTEWKINNLSVNNFDETYRHYAGLNARKETLMSDINRALKLGAEVYLMGGLEEHEAYKKTGRDILGECFEEIGNEHLHYICEGVSVVVNLVRERDGASPYIATIGLQTNVKTTAKTASANVSAAESWGGTLVSDVNFIMNTNAVGEFAPNCFYTSGQASYIRTPKGKIPQPAAGEFNQFDLRVQKDHTVVVQQGNSNIFDRDDVALENKAYREKVKAEALTKVLKEMLDKNTSKSTSGFPFTLR